jgi:hypothetical protein
MRPTEPFRREHAELLGHIEHLAQAAREIRPVFDAAPEVAEQVLRRLGEVHGHAHVHA